MQARSLTKTEIASYSVRSVLSLMVSPLDALFGLYKGYRARNESNLLNQKASLDNMVPSAAWGGRIATLLFTAGFIVALAVPIPGAAPFYALMAGITAKIFGVSFAGFCGRLIGATLGGIGDLKRFKEIERVTNQSHLKSRFDWKYPFKAGLKLGLFGESSIVANKLLTAAGRVLAKWKGKMCSCFRSKKASQDTAINYDGATREKDHSKAHNSIASCSIGGSTFQAVKAMHKSNPVNVVRQDSFGYVDATDRRADLGSIAAGSMTPELQAGSYVPPTPDEVVAPTGFTSQSTLTYSPTGSRQD